MRPDVNASTAEIPNSAMGEIARELYELGMGLLQSGNLKAARLQFHKARALAPGFCGASLALGHCLHEQGEYEQALAVYDQALTNMPQLVAGWNNRGNTLLALCRHDEAALSYARALELAPGLHDARVALATCHQAMGRIHEALAACEEVLAAAPEHAEAHWNKSLLLLLQGEYPEGWREYEWRWKKRSFTSPQRNFPQPRWHGELAAGKTILIHAEQGYGDTLQFCRYVPLVAARGARVVFECHPPLVTLMKSLAGRTLSVVAMGDPLPPFDLQVPLMSLPLIFDTTVWTIPGKIPYLAPSKECLLHWQGQIDKNHLNVGLCWAGKAYPDPGRSCPIELLAPLAEIGGVSLYSLQVGWKDPLPFPITDLSAQIRNFDDTAALVSQLDLVITIDTSVAHLAGALGKTCWVILPHAPDWRWMLNRDDSPWYPAMRLFRQTVSGSWPEIIRRITSQLATRH